MNRVYFTLAGFAIVLILLLTTLRTTTTPLGEDREYWLKAKRECERVIRESVADARFPFEPNLTDVQETSFRLLGTIDSGVGPDIERRNYVCYLSVHAEPGTYVADSVNIWKSH